ncbi:hypothetical protein DM860_016039 [Cuscuta australis]|uniref:Uncharacterized protein n=1 Tax=Cuscuta australis TaxID=267555 RepID=A0A328E3Q8_9ASTE|nr:hypothetical protein DM860_016039 [Cuscuta australis]
MRSGPDMSSDQESAFFIPKTQFEKKSLCMDDSEEEDCDEEVNEIIPDSEDGYYDEELIVLESEKRDDDEAFIVPDSEEGDDDEGFIVPDSEERDDDEAFIVPDSEEGDYVEAFIVPDSEEGDDDDSFIVLDSKEGEDDDRFSNPDSQKESESLNLEVEAVDKPAFLQARVDEDPFSAFASLQYDPKLGKVPEAWHSSSTKALLHIWFPRFFV